MNEENKARVNKFVNDANDKWNMKDMKVIKQAIARKEIYLHAEVLDENGVFFRLLKGRGVIKP